MLTPRTWEPRLIRGRLLPRLVADHVHVGVQLSDDAPEDVGTAAPGTSDDASRKDHVHGGGTGGGGGTVSTSSPVSGDGSAADPVTIENQAIRSH